MSFVEGNLQLGIELAPGTLDRLKSQLAALEKGATLKVNVDPRPIDQGGQAINRLNQEVNKASNNITNKLGNAVKSTGLLLGAVGAAGAATLGGIAVKAILAGKEFNILQQQVRAGLTAILGTSKAAEDLLSKVNKLNDTSPFPRSAFLSATQQLVGFGVKAEKVIPIIDAVQNAVAGIGGDATDIQRFTRAFAQIQSQGRLTGDVLFTLGEKGIDAAEIIGKQMNKSGQAIKNEVTAGTLGADKAIDALTKGLKEKFDGAVENVAKSFTGARDRINARLRDIGAEITRAFINPLGGGAAVDAMNNIAKGLGNIRDNFIKPMFPLFVALGNVLVDASQKFVELTTKINTGNFQDILNIFQALLPIIGIFATKFAGGFIGQFAGAIPILGQFSSVLGGPIAAIGIVIATVPQMRQAFMDLIAALTPLVSALLPAFASVIGIIQGSFIALTPVITTIVSIISELASVLTPVINLLQSLGLLGPAFAAIITGFGLMKLGVLSFSATAVQGFAQIKIAAIATAQQLRIAAAASTPMAARITAMGTAATGAATAIRGIGTALAGLVTPANIALAAFVFISAELAKAKANADKLAGKVLFGRDLNNAKDLGEAIDENEKKLAASRKAVDNQPSFLGGLAKQIFTEDPQTALARARKEEADKADLKALTAQSAVLDDIKKKQLSLGAGVLQALPAGLEGQFKSVGDVVKFATENGVDFNNLRFDKILDVTGELVKRMKELPTPIDEAAKKFEALKLQVDALDKIRAAADKLKASEKALADLRKTTAQQLQDNVTKAESNLAEVRRNQGAVNDAVIRSELALTAARRGLERTQIKLNDLERERARLLADTGREARELADADAALARIDQEILDQGQRKAEIERDQADLEEEKAGRIAAAGRSVERSQIALNTAKREELELKKELNKEDEVSLDLTGLTVDQIKATLAGARAQSAAQRQVTKQKKSQEQINDEIRTAELNTLDATQANIDAKEAESDLVLDLAIQERENKEALKSLDLDAESSARRRIEQEQTIATLRTGDTETARTLKTLNDQIVDTQDDLVTGTIAVRDAEREVETSKLNQRDYVIVIRDAQIVVRDATDAIRQHSDKIKEAQKQIKDDSIAYRDAVATTANDTKTINNLLFERLGLNAKLLAQNPELLKKQVNDLLGNITEGKAGVETHIQKQDRLRSPLTNILLNHPDQLLKFLRDNGFGFANGGIVSSETFARIGEAGREVVLPLTRPARMADLLANSQVLHPVLAALGRIQLPSKKQAGGTLLPSTSPASSPIPPINRNGVSTKTVPFVSKNDGPATYGQIEELITVMRENGGGLHVEAPITVEGTTNEDEMVRRISRKLERTINEILSKRR